MADNVTITSGAGTTVAADDISSVYYQRVKTTLGPDGTATADLAGRSIGTADGVAYVDQRPFRKIATITPDINTVLYTTGDALGGLQTLTNMARYAGGGGVINSVTVLDKTQAQRAAFDIYLFKDTITSPGNNFAWNLTDADMLNCVGFISILTTDYNTAFPGVPVNSFAFKPNTATATWPHNMAIPYYCASTSLYVQCIVRGAPTYTSTTDLVITLNCTLD